MKIFKKTAAAAAVFAACAAPGMVLAFDGGSILFDKDGNLGASAAVSITQLDWAAGTILAKGLQTTTVTVDPITGTTVETTPNDFILYGQGKNTSGFMPAGGAQPKELTYQFAVPMTPVTFSATGTQGVNAELDSTPVAGAPNFFKIFYSQTGSVAGTGANVAPFAGNEATKSGTGFGHNAPVLVSSCDPLHPSNLVAGETMILCGRIIDDVFNDPLSPSPSSWVFGQSGSGLTRLDSAATTDNWDGDADAGQADTYAVASIRGNGSITLFVDVQYQNRNWFVTAINELTVGVRHEDASALNFGTQTPHALVVGQSWLVGTDSTTTVPTANTTLPVGSPNTRFINDFNCLPSTSTLPGSLTCDTVFQGDGSSTFQAFVPEPGALALLGLGLGAFGVFGRRQRKVSAA